MKIRQKDRIINFIREFGSITTRDAYRLGITQLGARIDDLQKEGYKFKKDWEIGTNQYGEKTEYKRYALEEDPITENQIHISI